MVGDRPELHEIVEHPSYCTVHIYGDRAPLHGPRARVVDNVVDPGG
jgi:hypothetical protein